MGIGVQRHAPAVLTAEKRHGTHCTGGWVGPRAGLKGRGECRPNRLVASYQVKLCSSVISVRS
jgi:hypothetical protein